MQSCKTARAQSTTGSERLDEENGDVPNGESEELDDAVDATDAGGAAPMLGLKNTPPDERSKSEERDRSLGLALLRLAFTWAFANTLASSSNSGREGRYEREPCMLARELGSEPVTLPPFFSFLVTFRLLVGPVDHAISECEVRSEDPKAGDFLAATGLELMALLDDEMAAFFLAEAAPRRDEARGEKEEKNLGDPDEDAAIDEVEASMGAHVSRKDIAGAAGSSLTGPEVAARVARFCQRIFSDGEAEWLTLLQLKL